MFIELIFRHEGKILLLKSFNEDITCFNIRLAVREEFAKRKGPASIEYTLKRKVEGEVEGKSFNLSKKIKDEGFKDGDIVEVVMLETPRKERTPVPKSQKYTLDFVVDDKYLITLPGFFDTMLMSSMKNLVARKLDTKAGQIRLCRLNEKGKLSELSGSGGYLKNEVSIYDTLFIDIRKNASDRDKIITAAREMVEAPIDKVVPVEKFETIDEYMEMYGEKMSAIPQFVPHEVCYVYLVLLKALVLTARTFWEILRCIVYIGNSKSRDPNALEKCMVRHSVNPKLQYNREDYGLVVFKVYTAENCAPFENADLAVDGVEPRLGLLAKFYNPKFHKNQGFDSQAAVEMLMKQIGGPEKLKEFLDQIELVIKEHNYVA